MALVFFFVVYNMEQASLPDLPPFLYLFVCAVGPSIWLGEKREKAHVFFASFRFVGWVLANQLHSLYCTVRIYSFCVGCLKKRGGCCPAQTRASRSAVNEHWITLRISIAALTGVMFSAT